MSDAPTDLLSLVRRAAACAGSADLLTVGEQALTAAALQQRVESLALGLLAAGLHVGDRVAILLQRSVDEAVAILAVAAAGGIAVPIHQKLKDDQVAHLLGDCEPFAVITSRVRLLALRDPLRLLAGHRTYAAEGGVQGAAPLPQAADAGVALALPPAGLAAVLLYTSGSTGAQKGIIQSHGNLVLGARLVADYLRLTARDHVLALLPFSFDYGLNQLLSALHVPCRVTAADHLGVGELASLFRQHRPSGLAGVPALWHEVAAGLTNGTLTAEHGEALRYVTNSGGALRPSDARVLRQHWPHVEIFAMYGLTEAFRSAFLPPAEFDACPESFGRALPGVELLLVAADGQVLDGPATGELVHAGALVALGYWRRPDDNQRRFRPDPRGRPGTVVYSGDIVRRDAEGRHFFVGRNDRLLKVQGHRVSPDEVALAIAGLPGVGEVAVMGVDGGADGHHIVACVTGDVADATLVARIQRRCRAVLPSYMQPASVHVWPLFPHNQNGKVDELALRRMLEACTDDT